MKPVMSAPALSAGEASLEEGPSLAIPGSRPPSPMMVPSSSSRRFSSRERDLYGSQAWVRDASASVSREASSERRASSPACREALMRTKGVLTAARTRVVELEGQLAKLQREKNEQDATVSELQEQVKALQGQMLERHQDIRRSPRKASEMMTPLSIRRKSCRNSWTGQDDMCSEMCSPFPLASPLQVCEAAVARLEGLFERSSVLRSHLLEWRVKTLEARRHRGLVSSSTVARFDGFRTTTSVACKHSESTAGIAPVTPSEKPAPQQLSSMGRKRRRMCPGALSLVAATANRCDTAKVLLVWTAWWSLWRGRQLKARTACEATLKTSKSVDISSAHSRQQRSGCSDSLLALCLWAWSKKVSDDCRSRLRGEVCQLNTSVDFGCKLVAIGRRVVSSTVEHRINDALQVAWTRWRDMVEANAYFRRVSAAHVSRSDRLRLAAAASIEASSRRQQAALAAHAWSAWRNLRRYQALRIRLAQCFAPDAAVQRAFFRVWLISTKAASFERFRVSQRTCEAANQVLIAARSWRDNDLVKACVGSWRSYTLLMRQGRLHRRQLLEVLAPECALVRMCLATWNRSACDARMDAWRIEHQQFATLRCQALDDLSAMMTQRPEVVSTLVALAWLTWRNLLDRRHEEEKCARRGVDSQVDLQSAQRKALCSLKDSFWRDFELAITTIVWKAWRVLVVASGPRFPAASIEEETRAPESSPIITRKSPAKSPLRRSSTGQASINGRPPSAVMSSSLGKRHSVSGVSLQSQLRLPLGNIQPQSHQKMEEEGNVRSMRHVRSDPNIFMKPPSSSPDAVSRGVSQCSPSSVAAGLVGKINVPLTSFSLTAPVSSRSSASTAASTRTDTDVGSEFNIIRRPSLASLLESTSQAHLKQGAQFSSCGGRTSLISTPREAGPSDRSTCCSSTPRSVSGGPDVGTAAAGMESSPDRQALGPACQLLETPLPQCPLLETPLPQCKRVNVCECQDNVLQTPVGPVVTPSPGGASGRVLHHSASAGGRTLIASDLARPMTRSNSAQFRLHAPSL